MATGGGSGSRQPGGGGASMHTGGAGIGKPAATGGGGSMGSTSTVTCFLPFTGAFFSRVSPQAQPLPQHGQPATAACFTQQAQPFATAQQQVWAAWQQQDAAFAQQPLAQPEQHAA